MYKYNLCDCSCADPCVFGKSGSAFRCDVDELANHFGCTTEQLPEKLSKFRVEEKNNIHQRFKKMFPNGINITIVEADRPE